jgi:hypothetical protein
MPTPQEIFDQLYSRAKNRLLVLDAALVQSKFRSLRADVVPAGLAALQLPAPLDSYTVEQMLTLVAQFVERRRAEQLIDGQIEQILLEMLRQIEQNERSQ